MKKYKIMEMDRYLAPYGADIDLRMRHYAQVRSNLADRKSLVEFANGHLFYGFHEAENGWVYREWAPNATAVALKGDFNGWNGESHQMKRLSQGNWELFVADEKLPHGSYVKAQITAGGQTFERVPLYCKRAVQDPSTDIFCGQIWQQDFEWTDQGFAAGSTLLIYEAHIGMAGEQYRVHTFNEFREAVLPRVHRAGYNAIQLMAIMEHPYYASFGYQVSNFFAVSSRFGTPEELKALIDAAHGLGIAVFLDVVHSHAAKNTEDGIGAFDGTEYQFFHQGGLGEHSAWDTRLFNYGKPEVLHFLLSNLKFWLTEYHFDGFRFDGVTSMLYKHHGLGVAFDHYNKYFSMDTDMDAVVYLQLANELVRGVNPNAVTIAEDMSGMPGMCVAIKDGGFGFDYRLSMGVPDFWIGTLKKVADENWDMGRLWHELTTRRPYEKNMGYCESHDQALVGDKKIIFWLADAEMYTHMSRHAQSHIIDRALALHKLIRLITFALAGEGYMNFMGNEFGHPEWIDFPREGNNDSYHYARRQWSLADNPELRYGDLLAFDRAMIDLQRDGLLMGLEHSPVLLNIHNDDKFVHFQRGDYIFGFNFHPTKTQEFEHVIFRGDSLTEQAGPTDPFGLTSRPGHTVQALQSAHTENQAHADSAVLNKSGDQARVLPLDSSYVPVLCIDTDHADYGGFGPRNSFVYDSQTQCLKIRLVPRTALVYKV